MNERIRLLAEQAGSIGYDEDGNELTPILVGKDLAKFAQLIVKECMRQVEEQYNPVLENEAMMKDTHWDGYVQCGVDSYVAIREHFFGVEE